MKILGHIGAKLLALTILSVSVRSNPVLDWDALMLDAIRVDNSGPTLSTRNLAILHLAIYDAVNGILDTHQPWKVTAPPPTPANPDAATIGAGHQTLTVLYPSFQARTDELFQQQITTLPGTAETTNGMAWGRWVAAAILAARSRDGANTQVPYIPSALPGHWRRTPPFFRPPLDPHWRYVDRFALPGIEEFLPPPPPAMGSAEYATDFAEVMTLGAANSASRTAEQSEIAIFWSDFSYTAMPPGHWHEIAADIARTRALPLAETARLFALLSLAHADAAIVCWEAKYRFNFWRPVTAIQRADEDGNSATAPNPAWDDFLNAPPFPEYPSGHSTFSKTGAQVLTHFFETDAISFDARSDSLPGVTRHFESLGACADEVGMSRIYGGIHFPFANRAGKDSGRRIADFVSGNYLLSNDGLPLVRIEAAAPGTMQLRVHGHVGQMCVLEASSNLSSWRPVSTNIAVAGGFVVTDVAADPAHQFYRVRQP